MKFNRIRSVGPVVLSALIGTAAWAQDQDADGGVDEVVQGSGSGTAALEPITVTTQRIETDLMVTPIAVTALSQEQLDRNGIRDIREAGALIPNFDIAFSPSDSGVQLTMRGINSNNFTEIGDPSVAFHVDGVYSPRPQGAVALMYDLEQLEVARGPQGTLFGRNSAAGSINVITARPSTDGYFGDLQLEAGNYDQLQARGTFNVPVSDTFAFRANFFVEQRDGWANQDDGTSDGDGDGIPDMDQRWNHPVDEDEYYGNSDRWAARLSGQWDPSDRLSIRGTYEKFHDETAGWPIAPDCDRNPEVCAFNGGDIDYIDPNIPGFLDMDIDSFRLNVNYALTDQTDIVYNFGWAEQTRRQQWDADMGWRPVPGDDVGWLRPLSPWPSLYLATDSSDYDSISHELQFQGQHGRFNWIVGLFDFSEENEIIFDVEQPFCCTVPFTGGISFVQPDRTLDSEAIFAQATWHATDRLHFTAGVRYFEDTREDVGGRTIGSYVNGDWTAGAIPLGGLPIGIDGCDFAFVEANQQPCYTSADLGPGMGSMNREANYELFGTNDFKESFYETNWRLGVDYDLNRDTFLYAYAATGSKAGSFGDCVDTNGRGLIRCFPYEPEEVLNYEFGYKGVLLDNRLRLNVAAFYSDYRDKQVSQFRIVGVDDTVTPPREIGTLLTTNAGKATIKGLEVEMDWIIDEDSRLRANLGLLDATFDSWPGYMGEAYFCRERALLGEQFACVPQDDGSGENDIAGNELPYSTPVQFTIGYERDFYLGNGARLTPWIQYQWEDEMHFTEGNFDDVRSLSDKRDSFGMVNTTLRYTPRHERWSVEAYAYNLTDERVPQYWSDWPGAGVPLYAWNAPRSYGLRFSYRLGD